jgi:ribosomal protein L9
MVLSHVVSGFLWRFSQTRQKQASKKAFSKYEFQKQKRPGKKRKKFQLNERFQQQSEIKSDSLLFSREKKEGLEKLYLSTSFHKFGDIYHRPCDTDSLFVVIPA